MEIEQDSTSHLFLAWPQVLANTEISALHFFTSLRNAIQSIVQTSTSYEAAHLYLHHFLKGEKNQRVKQTRERKCFLVI